jgi:hypothetical protein
MSFYKHSRCTDVVIMPIVIEDDKEKRLRGGKGRKVLVDWYNIANPEGKPRKMNIREQIEITDEEAPNWHEYDWSKR